jgi:serine/threonine-protein kinase RsbW
VRHLGSRRISGAESEQSMTGNEGEAVRLSVPALPAFIGVARLAGSSLANRLGFSIDGVDDVKIAIDELAAVAIACARPGAALELRFSLAGDALAVDGAVAGSGVAPRISELTGKILGVVVDGYDLGVDHDLVWFRLVKRLADVSAPRA